MKVLTSSKALHIVILFLVAQILAPADAHAYIDPGSGSTLFQFLIAGLLGFGWTLKSYWSHIIAYFRRKKNKKTPEKPE